MSTPRRHHYVPAFYLQQWAVAGDKLIEFSKVRSKLIQKLVGPRATGFQFDLYTLNDLPQESRQHLESSFFSYVDNAASKVLEIFLGLSDAELTPDLRDAWSIFLMNMQLRHPDALTDIKSVSVDIWDDSEKDFARQYPNIRAEHHPKTYRDYQEQRDPFDDARGRASIIEHVFQDRIVKERINSMIWTVFDVSGAEHRLLTSDRPVFIDNLDGIDGFLAMPISPSKLFFAANGQHSIGYMESNSLNDLVFNSNRYVAGRARKYVWGVDASLAEFVEKHISTRLERLPIFPEPNQSPDKPSP